MGAKIAASADLDVRLVKTCVKNLVSYNVIQLISIFQYSNTYATCPGLSNLYKYPKIQHECIKFITKNSEGSPPSMYDVFQLYCAIKAGVTVKSLCSRLSPQEKNVDERKLIQFGLMKGFIRKLHKYPVHTGGGR